MTTIPLQSSTTPAARDAGSALLSVPMLLTLSAAAVGLALQVNYGQYHPIALAWLAVALALCLAAVVRSKSARLGNNAVERLVIGGVVLSQILQLLARHPGVAELGGAVPPSFQPLLGLAGLAAVIAVFGNRAVRRIALPAMLLLHFATGLLLLRTLPAPPVDVLTFQRDASAALLQGRNPYAITFPDESPAGSLFYGPGLSHKGRLQFGYPYPPLPLLLTLPASLAGDVRYVHLLALTLAGALIACCRPGGRASGAAAVLLFTPRGFFVLQAGWIEPVVELGLAATIFIACRSRLRGATPPEGRRRSFADRRSAVECKLDADFTKPLTLTLSPAYGGEGTRQLSWLLPVALGLFLATKQYLILALPAFPLLLADGPNRVIRRQLLFTILVAGLVSVPFALWAPEAFVRSVITLQFHQPARPDALSFLTPIFQSVPGPLIGILPFALAGATVILTLKNCPRTPAGFALSLAATLLVFFAFNKQAFCNYYHFVIAAKCCAVASISDAKSGII